MVATIQPVGFCGVFTAAVLEVLVLGVTVDISVLHDQWPGFAGR